jgi:outer membrane protein assembly factor BamB
LFWSGVPAYYVMHAWKALTVGLLAVNVSCSAPADPSVWSFRTDRPWLLAGDSHVSTPVVDAESVFFCGGYFGDDDEAIHALSRSDGRLLWKHRVGDCLSVPWLMAGTVAVHSREPRNGPCVLQGFDRTTGGVRWRHELQDTVAGGVGRCTIRHAVTGDSIVFRFGNDQFMNAVRVADGTVDRFRLPSERREQPVWLTAFGSTAWFGFARHVWRWSEGYPQPDEASELSEDAEPAAYAAVIGTRLFLGGGEPDRLRAFDLQTGQVLWEQAAFRHILSMSAGDDGLYLNIWRQRFELIAVDVNTGKELWTAADGGFYPPAREERWLYANGEFSVFVADPATGRIVRTIVAEDEVITTPVRSGNLLLLGTINGALHAVQLDQSR